MCYTCIYLVCIDVTSIKEQEEKIQLLVYATETVKKEVPVVLTIAEQATGAAIKLAQEAEKNGASGLMILPPKETVAIYKLVKAERYKEALEIYRWFLPLLELDIHPKLVQYIKLAAVQTGLCSEHVRAPQINVAGK